MSIIVGIDEVGRGCWAGPLVAGAVILHSQLPGLKDSKLIPKKRREQLSATIMVEAQATGLGWVSADEVDRLGLTEAVRVAMQRALQQLPDMYDQIIIDGSYNFLADNPKAVAIIKADTSVPSVSAASIIAKVARDGYMVDIHRTYPNYRFDKHVGYGTKLHAALLKRYGPCQLHRKSYKPVQAVAMTNPTTSGTM